MRLNPTKPMPKRARVPGSGTLAASSTKIVIGVMVPVNVPSATKLTAAINAATSPGSRPSAGSMPIIVKESTPPEVPASTSKKN